MQYRILLDVSEDIWQRIQDLAERLGQSNPEFVAKVVGIGLSAGNHAAQAKATGATIKLRATITQLDGTSTAHDLVDW